MKFISHLHSTLLMDQSQLLSFIASAPKRYKKYEIPKRNGSGTRLIAQPSKSLKIMQRACLPILRESLRIHECALAYETGTGIKKNAMLHKRNQYLLKMDFKDFFPSIKPEILINALYKAGIDVNEADRKIISCLFFWNPKRGAELELSIGAPSSPFISNAVLYWFDVEISEYCKKNEITYTRYADDLTFSTNKKNILYDVPALIEKKLLKKEFKYLSINEKKTVFLSKSCNRHITGVTIDNNDNISLGRKRKKEIRAAVHHFSMGSLSHDEILNLKGRLGFAKHIEPDFVVRIQEKYGIDVISAIQKHV